MIQPIRKAGISLLVSILAIAAAMPAHAQDNDPAVIDEIPQEVLEEFFESLSAAEAPMTLVEVASEDFDEIDKVAAAPGSAQNMYAANNPNSYNAIATNAKLGEPQYFYGPRWPFLYEYKNGARVKKSWEDLTAKQWRAKLDDRYEKVEVYEVGANGGLSLTGVFVPGSDAAISGGKKRFRLVYNNFRYRAFDCSKNDPLAGSVLVGVGIRTIIDATVKKKKFSLGLPFLALSANKKNTKGSIFSHAIGLADSSVLGEVISSANGELDYEAVIKVDVATSVANQVLETMSPQTPRIIGFIDNSKVGGCRQSVGALLKEMKADASTSGAIEGAGD